MTRSRCERMSWSTESSTASLSPLLVNMVTAGKFGVKSGEGFYVHTKGSKDIQVAPAFS